MKRKTHKSNIVRLRLSIYRSNKFIYAQVIDNLKNMTIASENDLKLKKGVKITKTQKAKEVGLGLAKKLIDLNIRQVFFSRGCYRYAGRIRVLVEGIREGGVKI